MRAIRRTLLYSLFLASICCIIYVLLGANSQKFPLVIALLAVLAAIIAALPSFKLLELQEDSVRPHIFPHFDYSSRHNLLQLRVVNLGNVVAHDIRLTWLEHIPGIEGESIESLDRIQLLLPNGSASTLIGESRAKVQEFGDKKFMGFCTYTDSRGKWYKEAFTLSVEGYRKRLVHDDELPKTLRELQELPEKLGKIEEAIRSLAVRRDS